MLKTTSTRKPNNFTISSISQFEDATFTNRFLGSQSYEKLRQPSSFNMKLLQANKQKVKKRNSELIKLFKRSPPLYINTESLQKSDFMNKNEIFHYLVGCLKKERQGMINVDTISQEKAKEPKPIENKIREFLYQSLQQSLLMSQKQVEETKYFERLFDWFTDVFKERQMKLAFKKQSNKKKDSQVPDEDWIIRNTYKTSMPQELGQYQRKMLSLNQMTEFNKQYGRKEKKTSKIDTQYSLKKDITLDSLSSKNMAEKKLFSEKMGNSPKLLKSNSLLPILDGKNFLSKLSKLKQNNQSEGLKRFEHEWKKSKSNFTEHLTHNYDPKNKLKQTKLADKACCYSIQKTNNKQNRASFSLQPRVLQRIQAAKLGVTFTEFTKNKSNILKHNKSACYQSPVFHPYLTTSYFYDIKKNKLQNMLKASFPKQTQYDSKHTEESEDMSASNIQSSLLQDQSFNDIFNLKSPVKMDAIIENIDGLGLSMNLFERNQIKTKKK